MSCFWCVSSRESKWNFTRTCFEYLKFHPGHLEALELYREQLIQSEMQPQKDHFESLKVCYCEKSESDNRKLGNNAGTQTLYYWINSFS